MPQTKMSRTSKRTGKSARRPAASDRALEAARKRFNRLATRLVVAYVEEGRLTPKLKRAAIEFERDVEAWRKSNGRDEIRATRSKRRQLALTRPPDDDWSCWNCDFIMVSRGRLCFLVGCDPANKSCSYVCLERGPTNHN